ncbi:hypothetical protein V5N11_015166 [Cardamine amara subsp. amara]|uniref:KIB1-4 beta-propeller domain-containing protein n=1 Tax=Cardamine amara subsp. amara TaxID=228776 RepID=A0ABD1A7X1_CARAN
MSQHIIISRLFKPSVCKFFRHKNVCLFSSTTYTNIGLDSNAKLVSPIHCSFLSTPTYPFLLIDYVLNIPDSPDGRVIRTYETCDPDQAPKSRQILIRDKKLVDEVRHAMTVGFSHHGLGFKLSENSLDILIDDPKLSPACVHLPPLPTGFRIQSVAMSSSSNDLNNNEDWVVGVKSWGSQLSLFRPGHDQWINTKVSPECIHPFSSLMYSKKDQRFYIPSPGGHLLCALDLYFKEGDQPEFIRVIDSIPDSVFPELAWQISYSRTDHLVESPSGEQFLVKWYSKSSRGDHNEVETLVHTATQFMVFRAEESWDEKYVNYTEDIGDLCIFLGHSEAFCIQASSCPGLKPNCIYFVGYDFGVYDLSTKTCTTFYTEDDDVPLRNLEFPYWPPPVSLYS